MNRLRNKILLPFLALMVGVLGVAVFLIDNGQRRQTYAAIRENLQTTRAVFDSLIRGKTMRLTTSLRLLGNDFAFKRALVTGDPKTIESNAFSLRERLGADHIWLTDDGGELYADTSRMAKPGDDVSSLGVVEAAINEEERSEIVVMHGHAFLLAGIPVLAPDLIGALVAGFEINDAFARELHDITRADISFETGGEIRATTLGPEGRALLEIHRKDLPLDVFTTMGPSGARQMVLKVPVSAGVFAYLQQDWDAALEPLRALERLLGIIALAGVLLTAFLGSLIAKGVTLPIEALVDATKRLVHGETGIQVPVRSKDEVGQLGRAFNQMVKGLQEKEKIRSVLRKAVSKEIADELLKRGEIELGGEEKTVTVLFSDIRGFTTISESKDPKELLSQLNAYFVKMARSIEGQKGVIDKFIGDAVMALFGAPLDGPDDAIHAQRAALGMQAALIELNRERAQKGQEAWSIGVGINTGRAVAGTMGSESRWSYTVIGDEVNLASRLEGLTKHYGAFTVVSKATVDASRGQFRYRTLDMVRVKGKSEPVEIFELLGEGGENDMWVTHFEDGVKAFRSGDFELARKRFEEVVAVHGEDKASRSYLERIDELGGRAPANWDPARTMTEK